MGRQSFLAFFGALLVAMSSSCDSGDGAGKTDPCDNETCSGHGECLVNSEGQALCDCHPGYDDVGLTCVADCFAVECSNLGGCIVMDNEPHCVCDFGCVGVGLECRSASTCENIDCSGRGVCVEEDGEPACICEYGYAPVGLDCAPATCRGVTCSDHGVCVVRAGAAACQCDPGYMAVGLGCRPDECTLNACSGHGACSIIDGKVQCNCDHGYVALGNECRPEPCELEDCDGHGVCLEGTEGLECLCDPGYVAIGLSCRPRCAGVDCSGHGLCVQDETGIRCLCDPGYVARGDSCVDADLVSAGGDGRCGDGIRMPEAGEFCDDGDLSPGDGCDAQCRPEGQRLGERTETREIVVTTAPSTPDQRLCDSDSVAIGLEGGGGRSTYLPNLGLHCQALDGSLRPVDEPYKTGMVGDKNPYAGADCPEGMVLVGVTINYRYEGNVIGAEGNCLSAAVVYGATEPRLRTTDTDWLGWRSGPTTPYLSCPPGAAVTGIIGAVSDTTGEGSAYRLQCRALDGQP